MFASLPNIIKSVLKRQRKITSCVTTAPNDVATLTLYGISASNNVAY